MFNNVYRVNKIILHYVQLILRIIATLFENITGYRMRANDNTQLSKIDSGVTLIATYYTGMYHV